MKFNAEENSGKKNTSKKFVLFNLQRSRIQDELHQCETFSARKWHRRLSQFSQADKVQNALETVGKFDDVCNVCAWPTITMSTEPRVAENRVKEKQEMVFTEVMGPFRVESLSVFRF